MTPTIKPVPTTCMAMSSEIPNRLQARGTRRSEPPATPDAPQALVAESTQSMIAVGKSTEMPSVWTAARVRTEIVTEAPPILIVEPSGIDTAYVSRSSPSSSQSFILTGIFAAELLVKKAVIPLSFRHLRTRGYGFLRIPMNVISGLTTNATNAMLPTSSICRSPEEKKAPARILW